MAKNDALKYVDRDNNGLGLPDIMSGIVVLLACALSLMLGAMLGLVNFEVTLQSGAIIALLVGAGATVGSIVAGKAGTQGLVGMAITLGVAVLVLFGFDYLGLLGFSIDVITGIIVVMFVAVGNFAADKVIASPIGQKLGL